MIGRQFRSPLPSPLSASTVASAPELIADLPLHLSRLLISAAGTKATYHFIERVPAVNRIILVSNHRSLLDAPLLMAALDRPIRFACHYYMSRVPGLREMVSAMGAFPLDAPQQRPKEFFQKAVSLLHEKEVVGIFPEGAEPMIQSTTPNRIRSFHRGFAHLAMRAPVGDVAILPVAMPSLQEQTSNLAPLSLFKLADPSEPLFDRGGWHHSVRYQHVRVLVGHPLWVKDKQRAEYCGRQGGLLARELTDSCRNQIIELMRQGCS